MVFLFEVEVLKVNVDKKVLLGSYGMFSYSLNLGIWNYDLESYILLYRFGVDFGCKCWYFVYEIVVF